MELMLTIYTVLGKEFKTGLPDDKGSLRRRPRSEPKQEDRDVDQSEREAEHLLAAARRMLDAGLGKWNVKATLEQIIEKYPKTKAAAEARKMLAEFE